VTGTVIVGNITIRDDVLISPNSYVYFDVPSHSMVKGNPGKIAHKENAVDCYINFILDE
jgi:serine O-acetyltransferase